MVMNIGDKTKLLNLRINEDQYSFLKQQSDTMNISMSQYMRMIIDLGRMMIVREKEISSDVQKIISREVLSK